MPSRIKSSNLKQIHQCNICIKLPQKLFIDWQQSEEGKIPPEVKELITVVDIDDANAGRYESNTTQLLKCPHCGTYYFYNRYTDDGAHFMDPKSDEFTLRRYTPMNVIYFLSGIIKKKEGTIPSSLGRLKIAFLEGSDLVRAEPEPEGLDTKIEKYSDELDQIQKSYNNLISDLTRILNAEPIDWQIKQYIIESICMDSLSRNDSNAISKILFHNLDEAIRVESAAYFIGIASDDLPVLDIIHVPLPIRSSASECMKDRAFLNEIIDLFMEGTKHRDNSTLRFTYGYGISHYLEGKLHQLAFYGLVVMASRYDVSRIIPLVTSFLNETPKNDSKSNEIIMYACWVLRQYGEVSKLNAEYVLRELEKWGGLERPEIKSDKLVIALLKACNDKLKQGKTTKGTKKSKRSTNISKKLINNK